MNWQQRGTTAPFRTGLAVLTIAFASLLPAPAALADPPSISVVADQPLRFGALMVPSSGSRRIGADGTMADIGIMRFGSGPTGPAQFTITYDRGNNGVNARDILVEVTLHGPQSITQGGVRARLSDFETNLSGASTPLSASRTTFTIPNCRQRRCSRSFNIGARLEIDRQHGGANLTIPIPVTATILSDK